MKKDVHTNLKYSVSYERQTHPHINLHMKRRGFQIIINSMAVSSNNVTLRSYEQELSAQTREAIKIRTDLTK